MAADSPSTVRPGASWRRWVVAALLLTPMLRWAVLVHAVPPEQPWRTRCGSPTTGDPTGCPAPVGPSLGLATLRPAARCGTCRTRVGAPAYLVEVAALAAATLVAVAVAGGGWPLWAAVALAGWAVVAVALTFIDLAVHRLPDRLTLVAAAWVLVWLGAASVSAGRATQAAGVAAPADAAWVRAAAAALVCGLAFAAVTLVFGGRGFGLGDAKMALGAGAVLGWLGWTAVVAGLLLAFLGSGLVAAGMLVTRRAGRRDTLPFGPFLAAGTLAALAWIGLSG